MGDVLAFSLITCVFDFFKALFNTQDKSVMNRLLLQCPVFTFAQDKNFIFRFNRWTQLDLNSFYVHPGLIKVVVSSFKNL